MHKDWAIGVDYPNWMSEEALVVLQKGYLQPEETPNDMYMRIWKTACEYYKDILSETDFDDFSTVLSVSLFNGWLSPSTPVASNYGTPKNLPCSCNVIHVGNGIDSIYQKVHEAAMLTKFGSGLGIYLDDVRGCTSVHQWAKQFDLVADVVTQGKTRRGSAAFYISIEHPDFYAFIEAKDQITGDHRFKLDGNIAVTITDEFMQRVVDFDEDAYQRFIKVLDSRMQFGSPYIVYIDNANKQKPEAYKKHNLDIHNSNLCLTGDTLVLTSNGYVDIKTLAESKDVVEIWDGEQWVENDQFFYSGDYEVWEITLDSGYKFRCNAEHRWSVANTSKRHQNKEKRARGSSKSFGRSRS